MRLPMDVTDVTPSPRTCPTSWNRDTGGLLRNIHDPPGKDIWEVLLGLRHVEKTDRGFSSSHPSPAFVAIISVEAQASL
jgi:hypothetical protein